MSERRRRREQPWWSDESGRPAGSGPDSSHPDLPAWAARNLTDPSQGEALTPSAPAPVVRHRRAVADPGPNRLRGWGLAVVALAAAAGAVPLAVATLAQQDAPLPQVGTFPVASPDHLGGPRTGQAGRPRPTEPEHDVFADPAQAGPAAPAPLIIAPLARSRPATTPRPAPPVVRAVPPAPRSTSPRPTTRTTEPSREPTPRSEDDGSGAGDSGGDDSGSGRGSSSSGSGGGSSSGSSGGLLGGVGSTVGGVTGTVGNLLN